VGDIKVRAIEDVLKNLPLGVSALAEEKVNNRRLTYIIIKDDFKDFIYLHNDMKFNFKSAYVKSNKVISCHLIIEIKDYIREKHYPFHFNYYNESTLSLIINLSHQRKVYLILANKYNEYKMIYLRNNLKKFFRKYMINCIRHGYQWNDEEYKESIYKLVSSFPNTSDLWDKLGEEITMNILKK
jgi:hypothetical protein